MSQKQGHIIDLVDERCTLIGQLCRHRSQLPCPRLPRRQVQAAHGHQFERKLLHSPRSRSLHDQERQPWQHHSCWQHERQSTCNTLRMKNRISSNFPDRQRSTSSGSLQVNDLKLLPLEVLEAKCLTRSASKAAVHHLAASLAVEWAPSNIRVNALVRAQERFIHKELKLTISLYLGSWLHGYRR